MAPWYTPLTLQPEQSGEVGSSPGRAPPLERHDKGSRTRLGLLGGTNDIRSQATPENIAKEIMELAVSLSTKENTVFVSGIVPRGDNWNNKVNEMNKHLQSARSSRNMPFIYNSNISTEYHLNRSRLHLNPEGTRILANNFPPYLGHRLGPNSDVLNSSECL